MLGFEIDPDNERLGQLASAHAEAIARDHGLRLQPIVSNLRDVGSRATRARLDRLGSTWRYFGVECYFGSLLVALGNFVSADFHVHSAKSFDSSVPITDRLSAFLAEGVEVLVSTDHDYITDYAPVIASLAAGDEIRSIIGNELTGGNPVPADPTQGGLQAFPEGIGHWNAWPLTPFPTNRRNGAPQDEFVTPGTAIDRLRGMDSLAALGKRPDDATIAGHIASRSLSRSARHTTRTSAGASADPWRKGPTSGSGSGRGLVCAHASRCAGKSVGVSATGASIGCKAARFSGSLASRELIPKSTTCRFAVPLPVVEATSFEDSHSQVAAIAEP